MLLKPPNLGYFGIAAQGDQDKVTQPPLYLHFLGPKVTLVLEQWNSALGLGHPSVIINFLPIYKKIITNCYTGRCETV